MKKSDLRSLVYSALRSQPQTQFNGVKTRLRSLSVEYETADDLVVHEILWELLVQGILAPGMNAANLDFPFIHVTHYGMKVLEGNQILPHDYDGYMEHLQSRVNRPLDGVLDTFIRESVLSFSSGYHLASMALLGMAGERGVELLAEMYKDVWADPAVKDAFSDRFVQAGRNLKQRYNLLHHAFQGMNLPGEMDELVDSLLSGLYTLQRYSRDEAGNATGAPIERDVVHANLLLFPSLCQRLYVIVSYLDSISPQVGQAHEPSTG